MKKVFFMITLSLFGFSAFLIYVNALSSSVLNKVIYLDPGHGGIDSGATYKNIKEDSINLDYSKKLKEKLEKKGAIVYLTRYDDYDLSISKTNRKKSDIINRVNLINNSDANLFISIHLNSENSNLWSGIQVFYDKINSKNEILANILQNNLKKVSVKKRNAKNIENLLLLKKTEIVGVLIELGFISNFNDRKVILSEDYKEKVCALIVESIEEYFNKY